jgi:2-polyprenyl-6-methoxyphenol hydroxylase-like FAD-dependent oxidoreductase
MMEAETFVLVVGGGPVGLAAAIELNWHGVPAMLVTDKLDTAQHPKCNNTNARSMEHFRRLGIADELRSEGPAAAGRARLRLCDALLRP